MKRPARLGIAPGMTKAQAELCAELALRPRSALQESVGARRLARLRPILLSLRGRRRLRHRPARSRRHGISSRIAAGNFSRHPPPRHRARTRCPCCRSFQSRCGRARRSWISRRHRDSRRQRSRAIGFACPRKSCSLTGSQKNEMHRRKTRRNPPTACSKPSTAGASATCAHWPRCRKFRSANVSDRKACACSNWPVAPPRARWSLWKRRRYLKKPSNWSIPIVLLEPLAFLLNRLLEQICARLGSRALATQELRLTLELENFSCTSISNQKSTISNFFALCACLFLCSTPKFFSNCCSWI